MNGVALFAGIAGLDLGLNQIMPDSKTVCYVEGETYSAQVLHAKMLKGQLPHAPIYSDVRTFPSVANHFAQKVDFITAGFPCQPFSNAGSRKGTKDERWLWDSIVETIREIRPSYLFLENVSNLLNEWGAFDEISKSLAKIGFNIEWGLVRASDVGANHERNRLFIFAYMPGTLSRINLSHPNRFRWFKDFQKIRGGQFNVIWEGVTITNPKNFGKSIMPMGNEEGRFVQQPKANFRPSWWMRNPPFPPVCGVDDGISYGMDRLRALGNAVVPLQAAHAFYALIQRAINHPSRF